MKVLRGKIMKYIGEYNKIAKPIKWGNRDPTYGITAGRSNCYSPLVFEHYGPTLVMEKVADLVTLVLLVSFPRFC